jgi:NADPH2:quinone reductase
MTSPGLRVVVSAFAEDPASAIDQGLTLEPQAVPDPTALGLSPTDAIVRVKSSQINWVDLLMTSGQYQHMPRPPYTPGLEYAGEVLWTGAGVDPGRLAVGDRVLSDGFLTSPRSLGAYQAWGGWASYAVAPSEGLHRLPAGWSFDQGTCFLGNYETAYHCLITCGQLQAGETVLIPGATGSTGLAAVHLARLVGATVIAVGRSPAKLAEVAEHGAHHVICSAPPEGESGVARFRDQVKELTSGRGVDVVYDGVGGEVSLECLRCVAFGARFLIVGWASTPAVARGQGQRGAPNANVLPTNLIMMKGLKVMGCPTIISTVMNPQLRPPRLARLMEWAHRGAIIPHVSQVFEIRELADLQTALRSKWKSGAVGCSVLHLPG